MTAPFEIRVKFGKKGDAKLLNAAIMDDVFEETFNTSVAFAFSLAEVETPGTVFHVTSEAAPTAGWHSKGKDLYRVLKSYVAMGSLPDPRLEQPLMITLVRSCRARNNRECPSHTLNRQLIHSVSTMIECIMCQGK